MVDTDETLQRALERITAAEAAITAHERYCERRFTTDEDFKKETRVKFDERMALIQSVRRDVDKSVADLRRYVDDQVQKLFDTISAKFGEAQSLTMDRTSELFSDVEKVRGELGNKIDANERDRLERERKAAEDALNRERADHSKTIETMRVREGNRLKIFGLVIGGVSVGLTVLAMLLVGGG